MRTSIKRPQAEYAERLAQLGIVLRVKTFGDATSWVKQSLIRRPLADTLGDLLFEVVSPVGNGGPGQKFHAQPCIVRRTRRYLVIHQCGGYDV